MKVWLSIAALVALWMFFRKRKGDTAAAVQDGTSVDLPAGTSIGQIGARIENPQALTDFARALETSSAPRILDVRTVGNRVYRTWTDGRYQILEGDSGSGNNPVLIYDSGWDQSGTP